MIDAFDAGFPSPQENTPRTYDIVPEGQAEVEIVRASVGNVPWKVCDDNPDGRCLQLRLSPGSAYGFVFADVPDNLKWLHGLVARAFGLDVADLVPERLTGRRATVEIRHVTKRDGTIKPVVSKWLPHPDVPPAPPRQAKPQPQTNTPAATARPQPPQDHGRPPAASPQRPQTRRNTRPQINSDDFPF